MSRASKEDHAPQSQRADMRKRSSPRSEYPRGSSSMGVSALDRLDQSRSRAQSRSPRSRSHSLYREDSKPQSSPSNSGDWYAEFKAQFGHLTNNNSGLDLSTRDELPTPDMQKNSEAQLGIPSKAIKDAPNAVSEAFNHSRDEDETANTLDELQERVNKLFETLM
eukprot:TRINITY_DN111072_c0_g1_i1.p1 TRINITY_DN111072_c0_g1~~TRINITY_DN111072_c0_g1_i1.p1  ORF type:complete len:165 (-),score=21.30 TRINITY_DN111072_c0_g1_i1:77-571(-)